MSDTSVNLPNLKAAQEDWQRRNPDSHDVFKLNEMIGALSYYCKAEDWDRCLNTTFGYIKVLGCSAPIGDTQ